VVGVAAAGQGPGGKHAAAQYNLVEIGGEQGRWTVKLTRRGLVGPAMPPADIEVVDLGASSRPAVRS
ncbi:MAG: metallophosphatase, partial [Proteobacteria bacterium]